MRRLTQLDPSEVSLVPTGANRKRFLVTKEGDDPSVVSPDERVYKTQTAIFDFVKKAFGKKDDAPSQDESINEKLDGLSPAAQTAARAIGRIVAPHADELTGKHINAVLAASGVEGGDAEPKGDAKVKAEHKKSAKDAAEKTYKEHMEKLGYKKYPSAELQIKEDSDPDEDDEDEKKKKVAAEKARKEDDEKAEKAKKEKAMKEFIKADGTVDFEAISKSADADPVMVAIAKGMVASNARATAAEAKLAETEKVLKEQRESVQKAELVRKSFEFKHLSQPYCQQVLELAHGAGAEKYEAVVKSLEAQNVQMGQSGLFSEVGKSGMSDSTLSAWSKIEKAADGIVQKSANKISKEQAINDFLETSEGQNLYAQHQASRPNGI